MFSRFEGDRVRGERWPPVQVYPTKAEMLSLNSPNSIAETGFLCI